MRIFEFFDPALEEGIYDPGLFKAIFMAGPPGAGKNHVIEALGLDAYGLKLLDIDRTLAMLKQEFPQQANYSKSLDTTLRRQSLLQQQMLGLIINTTGRDANSLLNLNTQLKRAGYDTFMIFVDVDKDIALKRIGHREKYATDPADTGRTVDLDYFHRAYDAATANLETYELFFDNQIAVVTNNEDLLEYTDPKQVFNTSLKIASKKVDRFMKKPLTPVAQSVLGAARTTRFKDKETLKSLVR